MIALIVGWIYIIGAYVALDLCIAKLFWYPIWCLTLLWTAWGWDSLHLQFALCSLQFVAFMVSLPLLVGKVWTFQVYQVQDWCTVALIVVWIYVIGAYLALDLCIAKLFWYPIWCPTLLWTAWGWDSPHLQFALRSLQFVTFTPSAGRVLKAFKFFKVKIGVWLRWLLAEST